MLHTERFAERILFLGGEIEMKPAKDIEHIRDPEKAVIMDEERHYDTFNIEYENLKKFGTEYLSQQAMERSKRIGSMGGQSQQ